jgi:phosphopantothenoylcysteine decarboxylase/phosphopantothenate--cysteine ligase
MQSLENKRILIGVTGGIAAYKCAELIRRLKDHGADIRVVMSKGAQAFITPLTLQAVSGNPVSDSLLDPQAEAAMGHIEFLANDLLSTICLATAAPIAIAPAMNQQMWAAKATQANMQILNERDYLIWGPGAGEQACGDVGLGRMLEPHQLVDATLNHFNHKQTLAGQHWVITAGPTREALDPVRYITNHSSGKMGYALAQAALNQGAKISLISGPVNLCAPQGCELIKVESAQQMHQAALNLAEQADVFIGCAAVADYRAATVAEQKIKKQQDQHDMVINLVKNPDIIADIAATKNKPFTVGFAAETQDVEQYALAKLTKKNLDMIAANNVAVAGQGFNSDNNALTVYWPTGKKDLPLASKSEVASHLVELISNHLELGC